MRLQGWLRVYDKFDQGRDALEYLGWAYKLLGLLPFAGVLTGILADGLLGAIVGAVISSLVVVVITAIAAMLAERRLPIHIEVLPDPQNINGFSSATWLRTEMPHKSKVSEAAYWSRLRVNNFGPHDLRITALIAEFQILWLGIVPQTIATAAVPRLSGSATVDWLLPAAGSPIEVMTNFVDARRVKDTRLTPGDVVLVRIRAEVGSPRRNLCVRAPGTYEALGPLRS